MAKKVVLQMKIIDEVDSSFKPVFVEKISNMTDEEANSINYAEQVVLNMNQDFIRYGFSDILNTCHLIRLKKYKEVWVVK